MNMNLYELIHEYDSYEFMICMNISINKLCCHIYTLYSFPHVKEGYLLKCVKKILFKICKLLK